VLGLESLAINVKSISVFVIVLSILIIVHEFGHFLTARWMGVSVERFSVGFGKKLFSFMYKETEFLVCLIPLGGYVKMLGDERGECQGSAGEFYSKPIWKRTLVVLNGPVVNYLFALFCLIWVFMIGYHDSPARIGGFLKNSPAAEAGLIIGDEIVKIDNKSVYGWNDLSTKIMTSQGETVDIVVKRGDEERAVTVRPSIQIKKNFFGQIRKIRRIKISPYANIIGEVAEEGAAAKAGLAAGDKIIKIDSQEIEGWEQVSRTIKSSEKDSIYITYVRKGESNIVEVFPEVKKIKTAEGKEKDVKLVGIGPAQEIAAYRFGPKEAIAQGFNKLMTITTMTYEAIYWMITGSMSPKNAAGPVGIFVIVKTAAEMGFSHLLFIVGVISASLAIFNLLPIFPLDGGHLLFFGIEKIRGGRPLPEKVEEWISKTGFSLIILLAIVIFYNDFVNIGLIDKVIDLFLWVKMSIVGQ